MHSIGLLILVVLFIMFGGVTVVAALLEGLGRLLLAVAGLALGIGMLYGAGWILTLFGLEPDTAAFTVLCGILFIGWVIEPMYQGYKEA